MSRWNNIIIVVASLVLVSCASTRNIKNEVVNYNQFVSIYANLKQDASGAYKFNNFSFIKKPNMVKMNDLSHTFSIKEESCADGLVFNDQGGHLCNTESYLFRETTVSAGDVLKNTFGNALIAVASLGMGVAAFYTTEFDEDKYVDAVSQALSKINREEILGAADKLIKSARDQLNISKSNFKNKQEAISSILKKNIVVIDKSGLYPIKNSPTAKAVISSDVDTHININSKWSTLQELEILVSELISKNTTNSSITLFCGNIPKFNAQVSGCGQSWGYYSELNITPVTYTIATKKEYRFNLFPHVEDKNILIRTTSGGHIEVKNKSTSFITLDSLSLYVGEDVITKTNLSIEIPPNSKSNTFNITNYLNYNKKTKKKNVVKKDLKEKLSYGFAAKYKVIKTGIEKTLYRVEKDALYTFQEIKI